MAEWKATVVREMFKRSRSWPEGGVVFDRIVRDRDSDVTCESYDRKKEKMAGKNTC